MRSSRCAFSAAVALHRVFVAPIERSALHLPPQKFLTRAPKLLFNIQRRSYALPLHRLPRDGDIRAEYIYIVSEDNKLSEPQPTSRILASLDRDKETLVMVALPTDEQSYPICKILSKQILRENEKSRTKKKDTAILKTIELNWAIDPHDMKHRLERIKEFLTKGWRVDIVMAGKKKGRRATPEEAYSLVGAIRDAITQVEGSKEWKKMEGKVGAVATIFAEGKLAEK